MFSSSAPRTESSRKNRSSIPSEPPLRRQAKTTKRRTVELGEWRESERAMSLKELIGRIQINGRPLHPDVARTCADEIINDLEEHFRQTNNSGGLVCAKHILVSLDDMLGFLRNGEVETTRP
jgi:hypothetical protein